MQELHSLEKEFVDFLIVNGIMADDWEKMKLNETSKSSNIITLFSDVIMEGILRKTIFLEFRDAFTMKAFHCLADKIILVGLDGTENFDFTKPENLELAVANPPRGMKIYTSEKAYSKSREKELFNMIQSGCLIADGTTYKALCLALASNPL
jgi:hypothetical protein